MEISVIIPVYNRTHLIGSAVASVLNQTYPPKEVLVVDDGSTDNLEQALRRFKDSRLRLIKQSHQGVAAARNRGIQHSSCSWLAFLDSDDYWLPEKLEKQVKFHQQNSDIFISQTEEIWLRNGRRLQPKKYHQKPEGDIFYPSLARCLVSPSAVLIHKKVLDDVGLFDESLVACEDYDLWLRISVKYKLGLVKDELVVKNGGHSDQLSQQVWALDRFRVQALVKLLKEAELTLEQKKAVVIMLLKKLLILKNGARKRCRNPEVLSAREISTSP